MKFQTVIEKDILGTVIQDTISNDAGIIEYGQQKNIIYFSKDCPKHLPKVDDKVNLSYYMKIRPFFILDKNILL